MSRVSNRRTPATPKPPKGPSKPGTRPPSRRPAKPPVTPAREKSIAELLGIDERTRPTGSRSRDVWHSRDDGLPRDTVPASGRWGGQK